MNNENIQRIAREAGIVWADHTIVGSDENLLIRFAALVAAADREACAKVCEEKQTYSMPIPCPDGIEGCCVAHVVPARREKTGQDCAAAIRARGEV